MDTTRPARLKSIASLEGDQTLKTAKLEPRDPVWPGMELRLRVAISSVLLGQKTAKIALDEVASDWQRTLKRAGLK